MKKSEPGDSDGRPAPTAARKDDSSLFSVAALMKQGTEAPPREAPPRAKDESGIIDLKALALATRTKSPEPSGDLSTSLPHADVFAGSSASSLFAAPPAPVAAAEPAPPASGTKTTLVILGGLVLAVAAAAAAFLVMRAPKDAAAPAASVALTAPAPVPEKTTPPATPEPTVEAVVPGQLSRKEEPAKPVLGPGKLPVAKAPAAVTAKATAEPAPPPPEVKPPAETCDLQCQMQRAVDKKH